MGASPAMLVHVLAGAQKTPKALTPIERLEIMRPFGEFFVTYGKSVYDLYYKTGNYIADIYTGNN
jgi:hypothetical protein